MTKENNIDEEEMQEIFAKDTKGISLFFISTDVLMQSQGKSKNNQKPTSIFWRF